MEKKLLGLLGKQNGRYVVSGIITAGDLLDVYKIDVYKDGLPIDQQGAQREPVKSHYRKIGRAFKENANFLLPTSIVLSSYSPNHEESTDDDGKVFVQLEDLTIRQVSKDYPNLVEISMNTEKRVRVIDGQHRILGIEHAIDNLNMEGLKDFQLPFVLIVANSRIDELRTFVDVNSKAKKVQTNLALSLINEINKNETLTMTEAEREKIIGVNTAGVLNNRKESVWYKNIAIGQSKDGEIMSANSFVTSLKPVLKTRMIKDILASEPDEVARGEKLAIVIDNFWNALRNVMPEIFPDGVGLQYRWVIQKTTGVYVWHKVFAHMIDTYFHVTKELSEEAITNYIRDNVEYSVKDSQDFWRSSDIVNGVQGGEASGRTGGKAFDELSRAIIDDLEENLSANLTVKL